jgi:ArsR family transcriptional regulator, lead/cadmium/zinc/bismuth-responsive transcriptional repressor
VLPDRLLHDVAALFAQLGDTTRLRLVRELHESGELTVSELAARTETSVANASQHLGRLSATGVLTRRRDGRTVVYRIADPRLAQLCDLVCSHVRDRARSLAVS